MHDNTDTDQENRAVTGRKNALAAAQAPDADYDRENRPATKRDVKAARKDVGSTVLAATALPTAALSGITPGPQGVVLMTASVFLLWVSFAMARRGLANRSWNATLGRAAALHVGETVEDFEREADPT